MLVDNPRVSNMFQEDLNSQLLSYNIVHVGLIIRHRWMWWAIVDVCGKWNPFLSISLKDQHYQNKQTWMEPQPTWHLRRVHWHKMILHLYIRGVMEYKSAKNKPHCHLFSIQARRWVLNIGCRDGAILTFHCISLWIRWIENFNNNPKKRWIENGPMY